jgi:hypothetical protein
VGGLARSLAFTPKVSFFTTGIPVPSISTHGKFPEEKKIADATLLRRAPTLGRFVRVIR